MTLCSTLLLTTVPVKVDAARKPLVTKKMTLTVGQSKTIKVKGSVKKKTFKSKNRSVATVSKKGKVTAKKVGKCKITVTLKFKKSKKYITKKYTCKVTVIKKTKKKTTKQPIITPTPQNSTNKPNITQKPTKEPVNTPARPTKVPSITQTPTKPPTPTSEPTQCEHEASNIWQVITESDPPGVNYMTPICKKCGKSVGDKDSIAFDYKGTSYTYTEWSQEPSETKEGVLDVYQGVNVYDMTEEELASKYEKYEVIYYYSGKKDTFYGTMNYYPDGTPMRFDVIAKGTAEKIGSIKYPKYEVKTIDLGNGETTKVYGYYDREMADEVFRLLNEYRVENGLNELETSDYMQNISDIRSSEAFYTEMYNQQNTDYEYGGHERPNKTMFYTTLEDIPYNRACENLIIHTLIEDYQAGGILQKIEITPENTMQSLKDSAEHNEIMLNPDLTDVGVSIFIGYPQNPDGTFKSYKVAVPVQSFMH